MLTTILSKICPPKLPHAADVVTEHTQRDYRDGVTSLPDCPSTCLGVLKEWYRGRFKVLDTCRD